MEDSGQVDMSNWISEGHLSELALELWAAGEAEAQELQALDSHVRACAACQARQAEWRRLFRALASLQVAEPSPAFDDRVMARVRLPVGAKTAVAGWLPRLVRGLRPVAVGAAAVWTVAVVGGAVWLQSQVNVPARLLFARLLNQARELLLAAVIKLGAILQLSGVADLWATVVETVPGPGVVVAAALIAVLSGLAIWTLYRVTGYQPPRVNAHA